MTPVKITTEKVTRNVTINGIVVDYLRATRHHPGRALSFDWGQDGDPDGEWLLAYAILEHCTGNRRWAEQHAEAFVTDWVSGIPDKSIIATSKLDAWITDRGGKLTNSIKLEHQWYE